MSVTVILKLTGNDDSVVLNSSKSVKMAYFLCALCKKCLK